MTMTFKEWYDKKSDDTQKYITERCGWVNPFNKTGYMAKHTFDTVQDVLNEENSGYNEVKHIFGLALLLKNGGTVEDAIKYVIKNCGSIPHGALVLFDIEDRKKIARAMVKHDLEENPHHRISFSTWLFIQEDYSNLTDIDKLDDGLCLTPSILEIFGDEAAIEYAKNNVNAADIRCFPKDGSNNVLFDRLFFGENGWNDEQKNKVIHTMAISRGFNSYFNANDDVLREVEHFIKNVCSVDKKYLKYLYQIIKENPSLATKLYEEKKPDTELSGNEPTDMTYRYPVWLRKLFLLMGCCARKTISKVNAGKLKNEGIALLRLYNYDFDQFFESYLAQSPTY